MANESFWFLSQITEQNSTIILAFATVALVLATIAVAYFTFVLSNETKRMRLSQLQPEIIVYTSPERQWVNFIDLTIKNNGPGPAHNVKFSVSPNFYFGLKSENKLLKDLPLIKNGISYMGTNQEFKFLLLFLLDYKGQDYPKLNISISYESSFGAKYTHDIFIDFSIFDDLGTENDYIHKMSESLEHINLNLKTISEKLK
jgi:hypothetical protein